MALLDPTQRALRPIYLSQLQGAVLGAPLPLGAQHLDRLAADRRHDRDRDYAVCDRLCDLPAPGSTRLGPCTRPLH